MAFAAGAYVEFVRSTPLLTQLFFLFYILPVYGLTLDALTTGVLALGLHYSSYTAEVYRGGHPGRAARPVGGGDRAQSLARPDLARE